MRSHPAAPDFPTRLLFLIALGLGLSMPASVAGQEPRAAEVLEKCKNLLTAESDFFARILLTEEASSAAGPEYLFFRSDGRRAMLVRRTRPLAGDALLAKPGSLWGFNPDCRCFSAPDPAAVVRRFGFSLAELNPFSWLEATAPSSATATAGSLGNESVYLIELKLPDSSRKVRLFISARNYLMLRIEYPDGAGGVERTVEYLAYFEIGNRYFPRRLCITDSGQAALILDATEVSYNPIPDFVFTRAYVEELSR